MVLRVGARIDVNGTGTLLSPRSRACWNPETTNPDLTKTEIEKRLLRIFSACVTYLWLGDGIEGDDTDGHIDDLTLLRKSQHRKSSREGRGGDHDDANYFPLQENLSHLREMETEWGRHAAEWQVTIAADALAHRARRPKRPPGELMQRISTIANKAVLLPVFKRS